MIAGQCGCVPGFLSPRCAAPMIHHGRPFSIPGQTDYPGGMPLLDRRRGLVFGVANRRSIAWAIAQALAREGAELAFTFQGERIEQGVRDLAGSVNSPLVVPADVTRDDDLDAVFDAVDKTWGGLDILVHSVAFAPPRTFEHPFAATSRADFLAAMDISAYSL